MSHAVYGLLITIGIVLGVVAFASTVATAILMGHKREILQREKDRKLKEVTHIREMQERTDQRTHEIEMTKARNNGATTGTVVSNQRALSSYDEFGVRRADPYVDGM